MTFVSRKGFIYSPPEELLDGVGPSGLDTSPKINFGGWSQSRAAGISNTAGTILSVAGLNSRPGNVIDVFSHPKDYIQGKYEEKLLSHSNPLGYTRFVDKTWEIGQRAVTLGIIGASTLFYGWNLSKNTDGTGRMPIFMFRDAVGKRRFGSFFKNLYTTQLLFLIGGSLTSQHRLLQAKDGMNPVSAYLAAASPYGWYQSFLGRGESHFSDYMYGDTAGGMPGDILQPIISRAANITGVGLYASLHSKDILPSLQRTYQERGDKNWVPISSTKDVRRLLRRGFSRNGIPLAQLEEARNMRLLVTEAERQRAGNLRGLKKILYGLSLPYRAGRWRVVLPRYFCESLGFWVYNTLNYHYVWGKSWKESMYSGASTFWTCLLNQPWIQMLKVSFGLQKIPYFLSVIPSMGALVTVWSVNVWDRDVMLARCQSARRDLVRSSNPEYREAVRLRIDNFYKYASEEEKAKWALPLSQGGCGIDFSHRQCGNHGNSNHSPGAAL